MQDNKKDEEEDKSEEAAAAAVVVTKKEENSSAEDLEAILENNLKQDDFDFDLNSPLSILLDDTDELDLLSDMMIQPSSTHFQHPRQPSQNYAHCVNSYRQNGYQVRQSQRIKPFLGIIFVTVKHAQLPVLVFFLVKLSQAATKCHRWFLCLHATKKETSPGCWSDSQQKQVHLGMFLRHCLSTHTRIRLNFS